MHFVNAKNLLSAQNGMNIYRGCTHGCIYCDSRSECYRMNHDFEDVEVKQNAPELLAVALQSKRKLCMIGTGSMSDPYMHCEKQLCLTQKCAQIIEQHGFGLAIQTKSDLICRDIDLLKSININAKCVVQLTLTTADEELCRIIEPKVCTTDRRVQVLSRFAEAGIPTVVWLSPILPFINDSEQNLRSILNACFGAGARGIICFGFGVTLRRGDREYFYSELDRHFPKMKQRYIRQFGDSYECASPDNDRLLRIFHDECEAHGVMHDIDEIFGYLHNLELTDRQLSLF